MVGIYRIINKQNGKSYIGQSIDIERRICEHKCPNAQGNKLLHNDIQTLGVENFDFQIVEECDVNELLAKELQYIKKENPFYNTIGKEVSIETRQKISKSCRKWWNGLADEKKEQIIRNNLTGRTVGYKHSPETKLKISKRISEIQKQRVYIVETNEVFESIKELEQHLNACTGTYAAYKKGKIKTVKGFHVEKCRD